MLGLILNPLKAIWSNLKTYVLIGLSAAVSFFALLAYKRKADVEEAHAENANREKLASQAQVEALERAQEAARMASVHGEEEINNEVKKAESGDRTGFDNNF